MKDCGPHMTGRHGPDVFDFTPPEGVDALSFEVFRALMDTQRLNRQLLMKTMTGHGGHPGQAGVLWALGAREGISQRELADMVHAAPPTVTTMLQKMERSGLIERWADEEDQRITRRAARRPGRASAQRCGGPQVQYVTATHGPMAEPDRRELSRLIGILANNISATLHGLED